MSVEIHESAGHLAVNGVTVPYTRSEGGKYYFWSVDASPEGKQRAEGYVANIPGFSIEDKTLVYDRLVGSATSKRPDPKAKAQAIGEGRDGKSVREGDTPDATTESTPQSPPSREPAHWHVRTWDGRPVFDHRGHVIGNRAAHGRTSSPRPQSQLQRKTAASDAPPAQNPAHWNAPIYDADEHAASVEAERKIPASLQAELEAARGRQKSRNKRRASTHYAAFLGLIPGFYTGLPGPKNIFSGLFR